MTQFDRRATGPAAPTVRGVNWPAIDDGPRPPAGPNGGPNPNEGWGPPQMSAPPTTGPRRPVAPDWDRDDWNAPQPAVPTSGQGWPVEPSTAQRDDEPGWGRPAWQALLILVAITAIGVVIDVVRNGTGGVNIAIIVGSLVAILTVRRLAMFPVVIAPPLVYMLGSAAALYLRSGGPHNKTVLIDIATNWLVYGFPAMAAATAVVLLVAAVRMIVKR